APAASNNTPDNRSFILLVGIDQAMRACHYLLKGTGFNVHENDNRTLICYRGASSSQSLVALKITFDFVSVGLTQVTITDRDTGSSLLRCQMGKKRLLGLQRFIEERVA